VLRQATEISSKSLYTIAVIMKADGDVAEADREREEGRI